MYISNKAKFREVVAQAIRRAANVTDGTKGRRFKAIEKAADEIRRNEGMQFDAITGCLSFISLSSGKPRRVTKDGCSKECDCLNGITYHKFAFEIFDNYLRLLHSETDVISEPATINQPFTPINNVRQFPAPTMKDSTILVYSDGGIETSLCKNCGGEETSLFRQIPPSGLSHPNAAPADCRAFGETNQRNRSRQQPENARGVPLSSRRN